MNKKCYYRILDSKVGMGKMWGIWFMRFIKGGKCLDGGGFLDWEIKRSLLLVIREVEIKYVLKRDEIYIIGYIKLRKL